MSCRYIIYANIDNYSIVGPKTVVSIYERTDRFSVPVFHVRIPYENAKDYEHLNRVQFNNEYPDLCLLLEKNKSLKSEIDRLDFEVGEYDDENDEDYNYEQRERLNEIDKLEDKTKSIDKEILLYLSKLELP